MVKMKNVVLAMYGEDSQYGMNILNTLLEHDREPNAVLIGKRGGDKGEISGEIGKLGGVFKRKGIAGVINRLRERVVRVLMVLGLEERVNSASAFEKARPLRYLKRGLTLQKLKLEKRGIEIVQAGINSKEAIEYLNRNNIEIVIVGTKLISARTLEKTKCAFVNAHPGYLPFQRGIDSVKWAIYHGMNPGATIHFIDKGIDTGRIIDRALVPISEKDSLMSLRLKARDKCLAFHLKYIDALRKKKITPKKLREQGMKGKPTRAMRFFEFLEAKRKLREMQGEVSRRKSRGTKNPGMLWNGNGKK